MILKLKVMNHFFNFGISSFKGCMHSHLIVSAYIHMLLHDI